MFDVSMFLFNFEVALPLSEDNEEMECKTSWLKGLGGVRNKVEPNAAHFHIIKTSVDRMKAIGNSCI